MPCSSRSLTSRRPALVHPVAKNAVLKSRRPHPLLHLIPPVLRDVTTEFQWELERLWRLRVEATPVPIGELEWHFDLPLWKYDDRPVRYREQYERTMAADLRYSLHFPDRPERLTVLDRPHRIRGQLGKRMRSGCVLRR